MVALFVAHASEEAAYAEHLRQGLEACGYTTWREPVSLELTMLLSPQTFERPLLRSACVLVVWSRNAAASQQVAQHLTLAQRLKKSQVVILLDATPLPASLAHAPSFASQVSHDEDVSRLLSLLPPPQGNDVLIFLWEQAAHDLVRERKAAIDTAAQMLSRGEHREEVLALLDYLAQTDLMTGVRDKAQEVLASASSHHPLPAAPASSPDLLEMTCKHCGHVSTFNKRHVCSEQGAIYRRHGKLRTGSSKDLLELPCATCGLTTITLVDCEGLR